MMNQWTLIGNLTKDPQLFFSDKGTAVCVFSMAAESGYGDNKMVTYVQVVTYGDRAEAHAEHLSKGDKVAVVGVGYQRKNEHKGKTYYNLQCKARQVDYLHTKGKSKRSKSKEGYNPPALDDDFDDEGFEGDLPF